jgi:hypothetical protein
MALLEQQIMHESSQYETWSSVAWAYNVVNGLELRKGATQGLSRRAPIRSTELMRKRQSFPGVEVLTHALNKKSLNLLECLDRFLLARHRDSIELAYALRSFANSKHLQALGIPL